MKCYLQRLYKVQHPKAVQAGAPHYPAHVGAQVRTAPCAVGAHPVRQRRVANPRDSFEDGKPHTVYLSRQVLGMFEELRDLAGDSALVLPGRGSLTKPFAANALNKALEGVNFDMAPFTIHDLRRTGSTLLHEQGLSIGRGEEGAEPQHRRHSRCVQPSRICRAEESHAAKLGRLRQRSERCQPHVGVSHGRPDNGDGRDVRRCLG